MYSFIEYRGIRKINNDLTSGATERRYALLVRRTVPYDKMKRRRKGGRRVDRLGLLIAAVFIALMFADTFICHGWLTGVVVGGAFATLGLILGIQNLLMIRFGRLAPAFVVDHKEEQSDDEINYYPIVEFSDQYGNKVRRKTDAGFGVKRPKVGARVLVRYDPSGKLDCQIMSVIRWIVPLGLLGVGVVVLALNAAKSMR